MLEMPSYCHSQPGKVLSCQVPVGADELLCYEFLL